MKTFEDAAKRIAQLTDFSRKSSMEVALSLMEEKGELAQEIKIYKQVAGTQHKKPGKDGIYGECADVWICAVSQYWADRRILDWSPGPADNGYLNVFVDRFLTTQNMNELGWAVVGIAMFLMVISCGLLRKFMRSWISGNEMWVILPLEGPKVL